MHLNVFEMGQVRTLCAPALLMLADLVGLFVEGTCTLCRDMQLDKSIRALRESPMDIADPFTVRTLVRQCQAQQDKYNHRKQLGNYESISWLSGLPWSEAGDDGASVNSVALCQVQGSVSIGERCLDMTTCHGSGQSMVSS
jgi:hypothetical protein